MRTHVLVLAIVFGILGLAQLSGAVLIGVFGLGTGLLAGILGGTDALVAGLPVAALVGGLASVLFFIGALHGLTSVGLLLRKSWGRVLGVIGSGIYLLSFNVWSVLGVYGLWSLIKGDEVFRKDLT